jgi:hypothetical protein
MNRLPIKFENEILHPHGIYWKNNEYSKTVSFANSSPVSKEELLWIAFKTIFHINNDISIETNNTPQHFNPPVPQLELFSCSTQYIYNHSLENIILHAITKLYTPKSDYVNPCPFAHYT